MLSVPMLDIGVIRYLPHEKGRCGMINSCFVMTGLAAALLSVEFLCGLHIWSPAHRILREHAVFGAAFVLFVIAGLPLLICVSVAFGVYAAAGFASVLAFVIGKGVMAGGQVQDFEGNPV